MKRTLLTAIFGSIICAATGIACAGTAPAASPAKTADASRRALDCTPPNDSSDCAALHAQIRATFTPSEITMLFGAATSSPEYPTAYTRVEARYQAFLRDYEAGNGIAVVVVGNVAKP